MIKKITILTFAFLLICLSSITVMADEFNPTVTIEGRHVVKNNVSLKTGRHTFVLTANDNAPMPDGSANGVKRVTINSNETFTFGPINYTKPGVYSYTVSRDLTKSKNLKEDDAVYHCNVAVFSNGSAVVVFEKKGTQGKPNKIEYTDSYITTKTENVKTGDDPFDYICSMILIGCVALNFLCILIFKVMRILHAKRIH